MIEYKRLVRHHSQVVRQSSAKAPPPVRIWVVPPIKRKIAASGFALLYADVSTVVEAPTGKGEILCADTNLRSIRRCGEIGRRKGLKIPRSNIRAGSSPAIGTIRRLRLLVAIKQVSKKRLPFFIVPFVACRPALPLLG